jgi:hypothetical protein
MQERREVAHRANGRLHAEGDDLDWIRYRCPEQGRGCRQAQYPAGRPGSFSIGASHAMGWTDLTSEGLKWLSY